MSAPSSQESEDLILGFITPDGLLRSLQSRMLGGEACSPITGLECRSTRTFARPTQPHGKHGSAKDDERWEESPIAPPITPHSSTARVLISSAEASLVRTSPSPDDAPDSQESAPASSMSSLASPSLFDLAGFSSRTYPDCSPRTAVGTSESCLERWPTSGTAWRGGLSTAVSSECRSDDGGCSSSEPSLSQILEPPQNVPAKYSLSARAAQGILLRAEKRGRTLPSHLSAALEAVAQTTTTDREDGS